MNKTIGALLGVALALGTTPALAQSRHLDPVDDWSVTQGEEYCGLLRNFGSAEEPVSLAIYSYGPMGGYRITVHGEPLPRNYSKAQYAEVAFGGFEDLAAQNVIIGQRNGAGTFNFLTYRDDGGLRFGYSWAEGADAAMDVFFDAEATQLTLAHPDMAPLTLELGVMTDALERLETCEDALLESWDLDLPPLSNGASRPSLSNGMAVVTAIERPPAMLINRASQMVQVRLVIDEQGELEDCVLQSPNWRGRDARGVCRAFSRIGQYTPARNEAGDPVRALLRGYYLMLIYD